MNPSRKVHRLFIGLVALGACVPAIGAITYTCDPSVAALVSCATLNSTLGPIYSAAFTDADANIYIAINTNAAVSLGESVKDQYSVSYSAYLSALGASDPLDPGLASLPATNPYGTGTVTVSNSLLYALPTLGAPPDGVTGTNLGGSSAPTFAACAGLNFNGTSSGCYDGIILVNGSSSDLWFRTGAQTGSQYDFFSIVEHETDEVLGTSSCLANGTGLDACEGNSTPGPNSNVAAADLFRYACASATRSFVDTGSACFSVNGGATDFKTYNNTTNGDDFGDWSTNCANVQDATGCPGPAVGFQHDIAPDAEIALLNAVGYSLNSQGVPEPGTLGLLGVSLLALALGRKRLRQK
jgi:PEP-CTERM motif